MATKKPAASKTFSAAEREAMKERAREAKAEAKANRTREDGERDLLAKVTEMPPADRTLAKKLHTIVTKSAPELMPKTWYGMPAWANSDGKVVCFFQGASRFDSRYATFGFNDSAKLDQGDMWPTTFALRKLSAADEKKIVALVKRAVS